jgi:hypothetical protein
MFPPKPLNLRISNSYKEDQWWSWKLTAMWGDSRDGRDCGEPSPSLQMGILFIGMKWILGMSCPAQPLAIRWQFSLGKFHQTTQSYLFISAFVCLLVSFSLQECLNGILFVIRFCFFGFFPSKIWNGREYKIPHQLLSQLQIAEAVYWKKESSQKSWASVIITRATMRQMEKMAKAERAEKSSS